MQNKSLEIVYLRNRAEVFLLQVQGSGRVTLTDGSVIRVGYDGKNGHEYISIGQILIKRGVFSAENISGHAIKHWLTLNPQIADELLYQNPSYIFFKVMSDLEEEVGPIGTSNSSLEDPISFDKLFLKCFSSNFHHQSEDLKSDELEGSPRNESQCLRIKIFLHCQVL